VPSLTRPNVSDGPLIRELVADNQKDIGTTVGRVEQGFEKTYDNESPGARDSGLALERTAQHN
jgi:hypothetical protein